MLGSSRRMHTRIACRTPRRRGRKDRTATAALAEKCKPLRVRRTLLAFDMERIAAAVGSMIWPAARGAGRVGALPFCARVRSIADSGPWHKWTASRICGAFERDRGDAVSRFWRQLQRAAASPRHPG